jgi:hypothetical protein
MQRKVRQEEQRGRAVRGRGARLQRRARPALSRPAPAPRPRGAAVVRAAPAPFARHRRLRLVRGVADGLALRLTASDAALHESLRPEEPVERMLFEMLEQFRAEAMAPEAMMGMRRNLRHRHEQWSLAFHHSGLTDTARGLLLYAVAQICRARVSGEQVVEETEDMLEATRFALAPLIGHALAGLRRDRADQAAYAVHALAIARTVAAMLHEADGRRKQRGTRPARGRQAQRVQPGRRHGPGDHRALHHRRVGPQRGARRRGRRLPRLHHRLRPRTRRRHARTQGGAGRPPREARPPHCRAGREHRPPRARTERAAGRARARRLGRRTGRRPHRRAPARAARGLAHRAPPVPHRAHGARWPIASSAFSSTARAR